MRQGGVLALLNKRSWRCWEKLMLLLKKRENHDEVNCDFMFPALTLFSVQCQR